MVVAAQVQHAVDHGLLQIGRLRRADHHVAELARARRGADPVHREREHVGGPFIASVLMVQSGDLGGRDESDGEVPVGDARRGQRRASGNLEGPVPPDDLYLDQAFLRPAALSPGACLSAYSL